MRNRLGIIVMALATGGLGACQIKDKGLGVGDPLGVTVGTGGSGGSSRPSTPMGMPAPNPAPGPGPMTTPPAPDADPPAGPLPTPDAGPKPDPSMPPPTTPAPEPPAADASVPTDVAPVQPPVNACAGPRPPVAARPVAAIPRSDEFTFDNDGHLIALSGDNLVRIDGSRSMPQVLFRNVSSLRNGGALRVLADGDILIADYSRDRLLRVDLNTGRERGPMLVQSPIKMVQGPGGLLYITSNQGNIYRLRLNGTFGGNLDVVARTNLRLGGITFSLDYKTAYVGASDERALYSLPVEANGSLGRPTLFVANVASPVTLTTDECGNIYAGGSDDGRIRRVGASRQAEIVANLDANDIWAIAFGSGKHGWSATALYALDHDQGRLYEVEMGVKSAPPPTR